MNENTGNMAAPLLFEKKKQKNGRYLLDLFFERNGKYLFWIFLYQTYGTAPRGQFFLSSETAGVLHSIIQNNTLSKLRRWSRKTHEYIMSTSKQIKMACVPLVNAQVRYRREAKSVRGRRWTTFGSERSRSIFYNL